MQAASSCLAASAAMTRRLVSFLQVNKTDQRKLYVYCSLIINIIELKNSYRALSVAKSRPNASRDRLHETPQGNHVTQHKKRDLIQRRLLHDPQELLLGYLAIAVPVRLIDHLLKLLVSLREVERRYRGADRSCSHTFKYLD